MWRRASWQAVVTEERTRGSMPRGEMALWRARARRRSTGHGGLDSPPLVSVVMPNFNKGPYIERAIASVLKQTLQDFELVLVDDGSTDGSLEAGESLARSDPRVVPKALPGHRGLPAALNEGLRAARSPVVTFMGSDDVASPRRLQRISEFFGGMRSPAVLYSDLTVVDETAATLEQDTLSRRIRPSGMILPSLLAGSFEFHGGPFATQREVLAEAGPFDETLTWGEDFDMCLRLAARHEFRFDPVSTYGYRIYKGNMLGSLTKRKRWSEQARILERHLLPNLDALRPRQAEASFRYLFSCYVASRQWQKLFRRGLSHPAALAELAILPLRAGR